MRELLWDGLATVGFLIGGLLLLYYLRHKERV
jgi:hypothetical protein